jgi:hypothetical protein
MIALKAGRGETAALGALGGPATSTTGEGEEASLTAWPYCRVRSVWAIVSASICCCADGVSLAACRAAILAPTIFSLAWAASCWRVRVETKSDLKSAIDWSATVRA